MQKAKFILLGLMVPSFILFSQNKSSIENLWAKTYGDSSTFEEVRCLKQTNDGGYIVAGMMNNEVWLLKLDSSGEIAWQKLYKNFQKESYDVYEIIITDSGGYVVVGSALVCEEPSVYCQSYGWIMKLTNDGEILWQKGYKDGAASVFYSGQKTADGGCILAGWTDILGAVSPHGKLWIVKVDSGGTVEWHKTLNDSDNVADSYARSVQQTKDGGYIMAGSIMGTSTFTNWYDLWVLKLNSAGNLEWHKMFTSDEVYDISWSIKQTNDDGYIVAGQTQDTIGYGMDGLLLKLDKDGNIQWQRNYESSNGDALKIVEQTYDGGYIAGGLYCYGVDYNGGSIIKTDQYGNIEWQKIYPCNGIRSIIQVADSGYLFASDVGVDDNGTSSVDFIVVRIGKDGNSVREFENADVNVYNASFTSKTFNPYVASLDMQLINTNTLAINTNVVPKNVWRSTLVRSESKTPLVFELYQNYPNPFNPSTSICFSVPIPCFVSLKIFDVLGREIATLVSEVMSAGTYAKSWNAEGLPSGIYFYRLQARQITGGQVGTYIETKKLLLLK